jgi:hypothetical protein
MNDFVYVPMPLDLYKEVLERSPNAPHALIQNVVEDFLERTDVEYDNIERKGIFWDKLFLPDGTKIRTKRFNKTFEGEIKTDSIIWDGKKYNSVSQLINAMRGNTMNNAWLFAELKRPQDVTWVLADELRKRRI